MSRLDKTYVVEKKQNKTKEIKQIITKQSIFLIQGLPAVDSEDTAETNWFQVRNGDLSSNASQILNMQRYIERSLQELISITTFILFKKKEKNCVIVKSLNIIENFNSWKDYFKWRTLLTESDTEEQYGSGSTWTFHKTNGPGKWHLIKYY